LECVFPRDSLKFALSSHFLAYFCVTHLQYAEILIKGVFCLPKLD